MINTNLIINHIVKTSFLLTFLLLSACTSTPTASEINLTTEQLLSELKVSSHANLVKDEIQKTEMNLSQAKKAEKNNDTLARLLAEKARSDVEYAKTKVTADKYKIVTTNQQENLNKVQKIYNTKQ